MEDTMIGGYDTLVVTRQKQRTILLRFLGELKKRWPLLRISINGDRYLRRGVIPEELPTESHFHVVRDKKMMQHFDKTGGVPMEDGEGPLSFWYYEEGPGPYSITMVSPANPECDAFSGEIWDLLKKACEPNLIESYVLRDA